MKNKVTQKIEELKVFTKTKWDLDINVTVKYNLNSSQSLGQFSPRTLDIFLNLNLLNEYKELYITEILVHEYAHAVITKMYPTGYNGRKRIMPHGREFKAVCSWFGIDGKATSSLFNDSKTMKKRKTQTRIKYKCSCQTHEITKNRHNKILNGSNYNCTKCGTRLVKA